MVGLKREILLYLTIKVLRLALWLVPKGEFSVALCSFIVQNTRKIK